MSYTRLSQRLMTAFMATAMVFSVVPTGVFVKAGGVSPTLKTIPASPDVYFDFVRRIVVDDKIIDTVTYKNASAHEFSFVAGTKTLAYHPDARFLYWSDGVTGQILSYNTTYVFVPHGYCEVEAFYTEHAEEPVEPADSDDKGGNERGSKEQRAAEKDESAGRQASAVVRKKADAASDENPDKGKASSALPKTGDPTNLALIAGLVALSGVCFVGAVFLRRKPR